MSSLVCVWPALVLLLGVAPLGLSAPPPPPASVVVVGDLRVSALSATLLRIEPRGPQGFEDRATFMVPPSGRVRFATPSVTLKVKNTTAAGTWLESEEYLVFVPSNISGSGSGCDSGHADTDVVDAVRSSMYPDGVRANSAAACCKLCEQTSDCRLWVYAPLMYKCYPLSAAGGFTSASARITGVPSSSGNHTPGCSGGQEGTDVENAVRSSMYPEGAQANSAAACCKLCLLADDCRLWVYAPLMYKCYPLSAASGFKTASGRITGARSTLQGVKVVSPSGRLLWTPPATGVSGLLHWPSPLQQSSVAVADSPRFYVPPWGPTPIPPNATVDPALRATNGYDFGNNVFDDTYIFLLSDTLDAWYHSRNEFLALTGSTPLLPDFAYGTWYTWYIPYTEDEAKSDIENWEKGKFPLDVWALDMNWRQTTNASKTLPHHWSCKSQLNDSPGCTDHFYTYPNTTLMPGLGGRGTEWFDFIKQHGLKTYFNDHPYPLDVQTSPREIGFRFDGLTRWISRGLTYWWFDHNWGFTMPVPGKMINDTSPWDALTSQVWGSHVYYEVTAAINAQLGLGRALTLNRDNGPNWRTGDNNTEGSAFSAHHRYPVWWTGDGVPLMASVQTMVDEGVHDFRAFVHSDCGGHGTNSRASYPDPAAPTNAALLRWTGHCVFGTILRYHQGDHRFWLRPKDTQNQIRNYLKTRYALAPSLIAAGRTLQDAGFPIVARCDLVWPTYAEARNNTQYLHLNATLIAPLEETATTRDVWLPPGAWQDAWTGRVVSGPKTITVTSPPEQIPAWHKHGSVLVTTMDTDATRIEAQDWSRLVIQAFPGHRSQHTLAERVVVPQEADPHQDAQTRITLLNDGQGSVELHISEAAAAQVIHHTTWGIRLHLSPGHRITSAQVKMDGVEMEALADAADIRHLQPKACTEDHFPFGGMGSRPACAAGPVAELTLHKDNSNLAAARTISVKLDMADGQDG